MGQPAIDFLRISLGIAGVNVLSRISVRDTEKVHLVMKKVTFYGDSTADFRRLAFSRRLVSENPLLNHHKM